MVFAETDAIIEKEADLETEEQGLVQPFRSKQCLARPTRRCFCGIAASIALAAVAGVVLRSAFHGEERAPFRDTGVISADLVQSCPSAYPFQCTSNWNGLVCFKTGDSAKQCSGNSGSWCALQGYANLSDIGHYISDGTGTTCASCPEAYPYRCTGKWSGLICYTAENLANQCNGPSRSWCALPGYEALSDVSRLVSGGDGATCALSAPLVQRCPLAYPYRCNGKWNGLVCFDAADLAKQCNGPARSWCALPGYANLSDINRYFSNGTGLACEFVQTCPLAYPHRCIGNWNDLVCFKGENSAKKCNVSARSWCALPGYVSLSDISRYVSDGTGIICARCPRAYPYQCTDKWSGLTCYNAQNLANQCNGPSRSWCALPGYGAFSDIGSLVSHGMGTACESGAQRPEFD